VASEAERAAGLDGQLEASFREFEERMARERARLAEQGVPAPVGGAVTGPAAGGGSAAGAGGEAVEDASAGGGAATEQAGAPDDSGGVASTGGAPERVDGGTGGVPVPPDVADGKDDDIVARQIREAAMSEPDPELREKLWDEYRKYKRGGQAPEKAPSEEPGEEQVDGGPQGD
jgi:hypothetical protein